MPPISVSHSYLFLEPAGISTNTITSASVAAAALPGAGALQVRLVLWDIDGTLVDSVRLGLAAFEDAFEQVTGKPPPESVPFAGRTDYEIAVDLLDRSGLELHDGLLERFGVELERAMIRRAGELRARGRAYPGARNCLERLGREPDVVQSLLTGNIAPNAQVKLGAFALDTLVDLRSAPTAPITTAAAGWSELRCRSASASTTRRWLPAMSC